MLAFTRRHNIGRQPLCHRFVMRIESRAAPLNARRLGGSPQTIELPLSDAEAHLAEIGLQLAHGRNGQMPRRLEPTPVVTEMAPQQTGRIRQREEKRAAWLE